MDTLGPTPAPGKIHLNRVLSSTDIFAELLATDKIVDHRQFAIRLVLHKDLVWGALTFRIEHSANSCNERVRFAHLTKVNENTIMMSHSRNLSAGGKDDSFRYYDDKRSFHTQ